MTARVFDSSAILAIVFDEPGSERAIEMLDGGLVSTVNYSEALAKMLQKGFIDREAVDGLAAFTFEIVPFDQSQAERTARLRAPTASRGLSIGDRACLSLAISRGLAAVTTDRSWSGLDIDCEIELLR
jgi:PIN domain nuclease of toxin-antitoxin system